MTDKQAKNTLISDSGIEQNNRTIQARRFVFLCNLLTLGLAILGILAFYIGNF